MLPAETPGQDVNSRHANASIAIIPTMRQPPDHSSRVFGSPWSGVYCTHIDSARAYGRHWHAVYGFGLLDDGAQSSASGRGKVDAYAGDIITNNPGEVHDGKPLGGPSRRWRMVYIDPSVMDGVADEFALQGRDVEFTQPVIHDSRLAQTLRNLLADIEAWQTDASKLQALACEESLQRSCALLFSRHADAARVHDADASLARVRQRLADDPLEPPTLSGLAAMAGLSKYQLLRRFEKAYGITPHAWLLQQRTERARALIRGGAGLAEAALSSGFADQSHMTRIFARQLGFTPGAWQKAASPQ
jgi:AraC-like DNA-binding protein